jgi:hypothetical protein
MCNFALKMARLDIITCKYNGKDFQVTKIPNVFTHTGGTLLIGSHSLGSAIYNDEIGYPDEKARRIDEQIYAYVDDEWLGYDFDSFISNVLDCLD